MEEFCDLVKRMRHAQKTYFRTRDRDVLREAQRLEREVDKALEERQYGKDLFDGNEEGK